MENQPKLNRNKEVIAFLAKQFPLCFTEKGAARPLKIGIFRDLLEQIRDEKNISKTRLRSGLRFYTSSWRYLYGIKLGTQRVDLNGHLCGELETQHVEHARKQLKEAKARVQLQRTAQQTKKRENGKTETLDRLVAKKRSARSDNVTCSKSRLKSERSTSTLKKVAPVGKNAPVTDISTLQVGQVIKVKVGQNLMDATLMEIPKEWIRVQLFSGMALIVRAEHLQL
ncbi:RNA chaperone ProQ [Candidatus Doolittlea endobia]|uniref:RNA chaperone ProQ n=1 Tax=Candidatus Doolittlea endobia TaxID=1778262 RepID=A0A143WS95_9ENTR|nr:RNA chaperone ProQ [Candidatus Doolittlea endobia]CUX96471.1 ProP effector [Candidatus Doolittlea endobia]